MPIIVSQKSRQGDGVPCRPPVAEQEEGRRGFMFKQLQTGDPAPPWLRQLAHAIDVQHASSLKLLADLRRSLLPASNQQGTPRSGRPTHLNMSTLCLASISTSIKRDQPSQVKVEDLKESAEQIGEDLRVPVPKASVPGIGDIRSLTLKQLLCGIIAGGVASFITTPLSVLRSRVIAGRGGSSTAEVVGTVVHADGFQSLMKGSLKVTLIVTSLTKGIQFAVYEAIQRKEQDKLGKDPKWLPGVSRKVQGATVAGAVAGLASTLVTYPFNEIMDRLLFQPSEYSSLWGGMAKVVRTSGVSELYRGIVPALLTLIPESAISFYTYENVKSILDEKVGEGKKTFREMALVSIGAGAAAGLVASALTYPLEVARKEINLSVLPQGTVGVGGALAYDTLPQAISGIAQRGGLGGFYRGFAVQVAQVIPMTALTFALYEVAKRALVAEREERRDQVKG